MTARAAYLAGIEFLAAPFRFCSSYLSEIVSVVTITLTMDDWTGFVCLAVLLSAYALRIAILTNKLGLAEATAKAYRLDSIHQQAELFAERQHALDLTRLNIALSQQITDIVRPSYD